MLIIALYKFVSLPDFEALREPLRVRCEALGIKGTLLLAHEGINGTVAGSREAFRAVDYQANLAVAQAALAAGARRIGLVSAMGADPRSRVFYSRVKGELEDALSALPLDALMIARPSLLLGDRARLGQPRRRGEHLAAIADRWLRPLLPARLRGIAAEDVAAALVATLPRAHGRQILDSARMQGAATA